MSHRFIISLFIIFSFLFVSCEADIDLQHVSNAISLHPNLVIPLGEVSINLGDLLFNFNTDGKFVTVDKEIYFQYFDTRPVATNKTSAGRTLNRLWNLRFRSKRLLYKRKVTFK